MNWNRQMEEMVGAWTDMQHKMWDGWLGAVKGFGAREAGGDWQREYQKNLEAWERSVHEALDAQAQWSRAWSEQAPSAQGGPEAAQRWLEQVQEMMKGWTEAQTQLWNAWFESVRRLDPSDASGVWEREGQQVMQAWQEAAQRAQETLAQWSRAAGQARESGDSGDRKK